MTIEKKEIDVSDALVVANAAKEEAEAMMAMALAFTVTCPDEFVAANEELKAIKKQIKKYETQRQEMKAPALEAGRRVDAFFKPAIEVLEKIEGIIKKQMIDYQRECERKRREAEEEARKELEKAERARIKAIERGDVAKVAKAEEKVVAIAATVANVPEIPVAKGFSVTKTWKAEVVDLMLLVKAVAAGKQPISLLLFNQGEGDALAAAHKENLAVPGVIAVSRDSAASRA